MEILRIGALGKERPAVRDEEGVLFDLAPLTDEIDGSFLADKGLERVHDALSAGSLHPFDGVVPDAAARRFGAPIARPSAVLCIGQNYAAHARGVGRRAAANPIIFFEHPNTVVGPDDDVIIPRGSSKTDWEVELAVVIGRRARTSSHRRWRRHVAGYAVSNDVSERDYQLEESGGQWSKGKSCETFNPLGPWLVPAWRDRRPERPAGALWVNGEPRQDSTTADMIFRWHLSGTSRQFLTLDPGDLINTGTPEGVALSGRFPYLAAGDVVELEIDRLGRQRQVMVREPDSRRPPHERGRGADDVLLQRLVEALQLAALQGGEQHAVLLSDLRQVVVPRRESIELQPDPG